MPAKRNILLINPWIYDFTAYDFWMKPLGLLYVAALLASHTNFNLDFIDCLDRSHPSLPGKLSTKKDGRGPFYKEEVTKPLVLANIPRKFSRYGLPLPLFQKELDRVPSPDLVLLSCMMTYWYPGVRTMVDQVRLKFGQVPIILGGVYPTILPHHALAQTGVDRICEGPAENQVFSLINEVLGDGTCPELHFERLEDMPFPAFSLLRDTNSLPILTSRGCPMRCSFCASFLLCDRFEQRSTDSVLRELELACRLYRTKNIAFYDDALLWNKKRHMIPLMKRILEKRLSMSFHTPNGLHVGEIDDQMAFLLKRSGFQSLYLSQETFDENLIGESCPKVSSDDLDRALGCLERAGFIREQVNVYLIVGLPGQSASGVRDAVSQVRSLGARARLAFFSPIPGTSDWKKLVSRGIVSEDDDPLFQNKLVFPYKWGDISPRELESLKMMLSS